MSDEPRPVPVARDAAAAPGGWPSIESDWVVRAPGEPVALMRGTVGPVVIGEVVVVGSSAIGFAGLEAATGEVLWRRAGEREPLALRERGRHVELVGACAHRAERAPPDARACVERVDVRDGELRERRWVDSLQTPERRQRFRRERERADVGFAAARVAGREVWVRDSRLFVAESEGEAMPVPGRYAYAEGSVGAVADAAVALRIAAPEGASGALVQPVFVDTGMVLAAGGEAPRRAGDAVPAAGVVAATIGAGGIAAVVRADASLRRHALIAWSPDGARLGGWPLPDPQEPRDDRIGLAVGEGAVFVFYEGRNLARVPLPDPPTHGAAPSYGAPGVSERTTP